MGETPSEEDRAWAAGRARAMLDEGGRRRVVGVMVASVDARAALEGKSGGLSSAPDVALLKAWRAVAGGILVGARTLETERYGALIPDADRADREAAGRPGWPRVLTISRRLDLDLDAVLSYDPELPLTVYTEAEGTLGGADVEVVRLGRTTPAAVVEDARARYGHDVIACEGGPQLLAAALADGTLTDLSLTLAPAILGHGAALLPEESLDDEIALDLRACDARAGSVFAHYAVQGR